MVVDNLPLAHLALAVYYARTGDNQQAQEELTAYLQSIHSGTAPTQMEQRLARLARLPRPTSMFGFPPAQN
jgi:hypothetical protein